MSAREDILNAIRTGLGRKPFTPAPPSLLRIRPAVMQLRIADLLSCAGLLAARTHHACSVDDARAYVVQAMDGRTGVASNAPFLQECGIAQLPNVRTGILNREELRSVCATAGCGITSADFALADTGTLVMLSSTEEARMISLLPPAHIAIVPAARILTGLDELLSVLPKPAGRSSSMVLITGPSRTGDIEQNLVRGVHGPGEVHLVVV